MRCLKSSAKKIAMFEDVTWANAENKAERDNVEPRKASRRKKWKSLCLNRNEMEWDLEAICTTEHRPGMTFSARYIPMMKAANSPNLTHKVSIFRTNYDAFSYSSVYEKEDQ